MGQSKMSSKDSMSSVLNGDQNAVGLITEIFHFDILKTALSQHVNGSFQIGIYNDDAKPLRNHKYSSNFEVKKIHFNNTLQLKKTFRKSHLYR